MAIDNIDDFNREIEELRRTMRMFGEDTNNSGSNLKQFGKGSISALGDLTQATTNFALNVGRGSTKFQNLNSVVDVAANAVGKLARLVPYVGQFLDGGIRQLGEATKFVIEQIDEVGDVFFEFSRIGALTAGNIDELNQQFLASGQSLQNFRKTIIENSVSFAQFGGLVSRGADTFLNSVGRLADPAENLGDSLRKLGFNTDDIVESGAAYLRQQILLGRNEFVNQQTMISGTQNLALEMDRLAKITGTNRKQLQEQREAELREGVFGASIREMERAGQGEMAKQIQRTSNILGNLISPEAARGFRDLMSGFPGTAEAQKLTMSTAGEAQRVIDDLRSGRINDIDAIRRLSQSAKGLEITVDRFARVGGDASGVYLAAIDQTRLANLGIKDQTDLEKKLTELRERQQGEQNKTTNQFINANKELEQLNRNINLFSFQAIDPATLAIQKFTTVVNRFVQFIGEQTGVELRLPVPAAAPAAGGAAPAGGATSAAAPAAAPAAPGGAAPAAAAGGAARGSAPAAPAAAAGGAAPNKASAQQILDMIANAESNKNPNAMFPSQTIPGLTDKTIQDVLALQQQRISQGIRSSAAGQYQIMQSTLSGLVNQRILNMADRFNVDTQDRAAMELIRRKGYDDYRSGKITGNNFANNLATTFAALPMPDGRSLYAGDGLNRAQISRDRVMDVLGARYGGVLSGPTSGYQAILHGKEAVIPLSGGRSIPVEMPGFTDNLRRLSDIMTSQNSKLDNLLDMMRVNNNINKDMLRYQRA